MEDTCALKSASFPKLSKPSVLQVDKLGGAWAGPGNEATVVSCSI